MFFQFTEPIPGWQN